MIRVLLVLVGTSRNPGGLGQGQEERSADR